MNYIYVFLYEVDKVSFWKLFGKKHPPAEQPSTIDLKKYSVCSKIKYNDQSIHMVYNIYVYYATEHQKKYSNQFELHNAFKL